MEYKNTVVFSGNDEVYIGTGKRVLQILVSLNSPDPSIKREALCNNHQRERSLVKTVGEYWFKEKGLRPGEGLRMGLAVRNGKKAYSGGKGDNFRLTFPSLFEDYAHSSGLDIARVVAAFDGELYEGNERAIRGIRINGWDVKVMAFHKMDPQDPNLERPNRETMRAIEMVKEADILAYYIKDLLDSEKRINVLLRDQRLAHVWVGDEKLNLEEICSRTSKRRITTRQFVQMAHSAMASAAT